MDKENRPHSREKQVGTGSASVNKGQQQNIGPRPVGSGGRTQSSNMRPAGSGRRAFPMTGNQASSQTSGTRTLDLKKILIIAAVIIVIFLVLKSFGGGMGDMDYTDYTDYSDYSSLSGTGSGTSSSGTGSSPLDSLLGDTSSSGTSSVSSGADLTVSSLAREKRVTPIGGGRDVVTIMVYMCGTDLESKYGMATKDLQEMMKAPISDKINLVIETGGCNKWNNNVISNSKNQIYKVESDGLHRVENDVGTAAMTDPDNLTDFIKYCNKNYPADRNMLIFWDHGGGSLSGYGYDEKNPRASSMTLSKIDSALKAAGCTFDCIGFDACLMATLETALVCNNYADYMLASEESEPGTGWDYTGWLTQLSENTSTPTIELAETLIDDFVSASCAASSGAKVTLSVIDLAELQGTVPDAFREFASSTNELIRSDDYKQISDARAGVRQFAQSSKLNQVDLVDLAIRIGTDESNALADALKGCVKYNRSTISRCYGVSIFFPYETTKSVKSAIASYEVLGMEDEYTKCIQSFASLEAGGQIVASASQVPSSTFSSGTDLLGSLLSAYASGESSASPLDALMGGFSSSGSTSAAGMSIDPSMVLSLLSGFSSSGRSLPSQYDWLDTDLLTAQADNIAGSYIDPSHISVSRKNGRNVLSLTDEEWDLIQTVELNVFVNDGAGFIDLGLDNTFEWYGDDLLLEYDGTWLTLNGNVCAYYLVSDTQQDDGSWTTIGRIPALLNGEAVNLQVVFDDDNPAGIVTGAYPLYQDGETDVQAKGDIPVTAGDTIELLCDYYNPDGTYSASYSLGSPFTVPASGLSLTNLSISGNDVSVSYRLTDIYGNHYWTPAID